VTFGHYGCCATSCCACAPPREPRRGQLTFGSHVTTKKKTREKAGHAQNLLPDRASSGVQPSLLTTTTGVVKFQSHLVAMLLLLRKKRGENGACAEPTFRSGQLLDRPLPDSASSGNVTFSLPVKKPPLGRIWRNFRLRMRRTYFRTVHMTDVTSGIMTSGCSSSLLRKCGFVLADILLTIHVFL
jgi:hypothetical protein